MKSAEELSREIKAVRERNAELNAAILRVSATLDIDTVLSEIAAAARSLTGARYSVIITIDDTGQIEDYVMSGFSADQERLLGEWPEHMQIYEQLRGLEDPLRLTDMPAYVRALGIPAEPVFIHPGLFALQPESWLN